VSTITWRQVASTEIEVRYDNGEVETVEGTHAEAARMAQTAGLSLARSPLGTVRWTPSPGPPADDGRGGPAPPARRSRPRPAPVVAADAGEAHRAGEAVGAGDHAGAPEGRGPGSAAGAPRPKRIGPWLSQ
jgi:hypothetical protein